MAAEQRVNPRRRGDSLVTAQAQKHCLHFLLNALDRIQLLLVALEARLYPLEVANIVQSHLALGYWKLLSTSLIDDAKLRNVPPPSS